MALPFGLAVPLVQILSLQTGMVMVVLVVFASSFFFFFLEAGVWKWMNEAVLVRRGQGVESGRCRLGGAPPGSSWGDARRNL